MTGKPSELSKYRVPVPWLGEQLGEFNWVEGASTTGGFVIAFAWFFTKNWVLNNVLGISMCFVFLKMLRLNKLLPGVLLLCLLFFYDIFWVFYSPKITGGKSVMIEVATGFDAPIKILMPHISIRDYPTNNCSLLGLGDIVIPGIYIGFLIRFGRQINIKKGIPETVTIYRNIALVFYAMALCTCGLCLWIYKHAQPALLYIVPSLLFATFAVGICRGEISELIEGVDQELEMKGVGKTNKDHMKRIEYELALGTEDTGQSPNRRRAGGHEEDYQV